MDSRLPGDDDKSPVPALIVGSILLVFGLAAWLAMVPLSFFIGVATQKYDPATRDLSLFFMFSYFALAGGGTALIRSKLPENHTASRVVLGTFLTILVVGFLNYFWLGTLPNALDL